MDADLLTPGTLSCSYTGFLSFFTTGERKITRDGNTIGIYRPVLFALNYKIVAYFHDSEYSFEHQMLSLTTIIRNETSGAEIGTYKNDLLGWKGELNLNGQTFIWEFKGGKRYWLDSNGNTIAVFYIPIFSLSFKIEIQQNQLSTETLAILIFLGSSIITKARSSK